MSACPQCGEGLETPLGCAACGALVPLPADASPYDVFGIETAFAVDATALKQRLKRFSRLTHPDFFSVQGDELRERAEHNTAELNRAFEILSDNFRRASWLVESLGGPSEKDERQMPQAFLMEVLEWNETLEEAREHGASEGAPPDLAGLEAELTAKRAEAFDAVGALLTPLPDPSSAKLADVRRQLNAIRYVDRALSEIKKLRLSQAASG